MTHAQQKKFNLVALIILGVVIVGLVMWQQIYSINTENGRVSHQSSLVTPTPGE